MLFTDCYCKVILTDILLAIFFWGVYSLKIPLHITLNRMSLLTSYMPGRLLQVHVQLSTCSDENSDKFENVRFCSVDVQ